MAEVDHRSLTLNPISTSILLTLVVVVLSASRRWATLAMAAGVLYLTQWVHVNLAGINMFPMRFLEMAGILRVMARREFSFSNLNDIDRLFLLFYSYLTIIFLLRSNVGQAYQIGIFVDASFCYFTFRGLIGDMDDLRWFLRAFVVLLVPYVALLFVEMHTGQNPFFILGGKAPADVFRDNRVRCIGSFRHPSLMGSLGASFLPLYIGLSFSKSRRLYSILGVLLCLAIVGFSNSGGPAAFSCIVALGWVLWRFRDRMRLVRRIGLAGIAALALVMKAPIWYLPTHFSFGGDAWHRSYLIEVSMHHFGEWWLWGMSMSKTRHWFPYALLNNTADITNQYIAFGLTSGIIATALFIWLLVRTFRGLGKKLAEVRLLSARPSESEYLFWGLGVMLAGHVANFFAICYFDQFYVIWFMQLAFISNLIHEYGYAYVPSASTQSQPMTFGNDTAVSYKH